MRKTPLLIGIGVPVVLIGVVVAGVLMSRHQGASLANKANKPISPATKQRIEADSFYKKHDYKAAKTAYSSFIAKHEASKDVKTQDEVGAARMRLGFVTAKVDGYGKARKVFVEAAKSYKGSKSVSPDFGSFEDQAAYQAAVCLAAEGKKDEARKEFRKIIAERPKSPVIYQAFRRINRLGDANKEEEQLLQTSIAKQEAWLKFEITVCGPKTIEYLLPKLCKARMGYKEIAKLCGTDDQGTTMEGMRKGLKALGLPSVGLMVNRKDFAKQTLPAIWLDKNHFTALLRIEGNKAIVYDTRYACEGTVTLPDENDTSFMATLLVFRTLASDATSEGTIRR